MAPIKGSASYKKKDGTLAIVAKGQSVNWTPISPPGAKALLEFPITVITNLQQTPASSPKVMLKVFTQSPGSAAAETHVFTFTSPTAARAEADMIKDMLSKAIQAAKAVTLSAAPSTGSASGSMSMAATATASGGPNDRNIYDDEKLLEDVSLQQSLLKSDTALSKTFMEALRTKPDAITTSQFTKQFWSNRIQLLRAHTVDKTQTRGSYNVLSTIRPITVDNALKLSISKEQIQLIFNQHPLVKRVYDENVPQISESAFWSRFFQSRLFKKLKGERTTDNDPTDTVLDQYLHVNEDEQLAQRVNTAHIPHIIDLEGNAENHSQRKGNMPDRSMRPTAVEKVPIIRTLNSISEKILAHVRPNDIDPSLPIGVDEETYNQLALQDLQAEVEEERIILNVKDQARFTHSSDGTSISSQAAQFAKADRNEVLRSMQRQCEKLGPDMCLASAIGIDDDSDSASASDSNEDTVMSDTRRAHVGSKSSRRAATAQIISAVAEQRDVHFSAAGNATLSSTTAGLPAAIFDRLVLTHATTTEFLSHFWTAFLSTGARRADDIGRLVESLDRAIDRIRAVAIDAEGAREAEIEKLNAQAAAFFERTGRKRRIDYDGLLGGKAAVDSLMEPSIRAIAVAVAAFRKSMQK